MAQNRDNTPAGIRRVLAARFSAIGDVAMTIPALYGACMANPGIEFELLTRPAMTRIFVNPPANLRLTGVDLRKEYAGPGGIARLCSRIVADRRPDVFVDLHNVLRTHLMSALLRLRGVRCVRLEKPRRARKRLTRGNAKLLLPLRTQLELYADTFAAAGLTTAPFEGLYPGRNTAPAADYAALATAAKNGECWIGVAPFAAHQGKIYPSEKMKEVVRLLATAKPGGRRTRVFLFGGGEKEEKILSGWQTEIEGVVSLAGLRAGFAAEIALMNHLDAMLCMDSANMHLASLAGIPVVSIWGATHPYCGFSPWNAAPDSMIGLPVECRPCSVFGNKACHRGDYICLTAISPEVVAAKVLQTI